MYHVDEVFYPQAYTEDIVGYQINDSSSEQSLFWINKFLHFMSLQNQNTAKQYAYRLSRFLNFLHQNNKNYITATTKDLRNFILSINLKSDEKGIDLKEGKLSETTLKHYLYTIKRLYIFLDEQDQDFLMNLKEEKIEADKHRFLFGNVWEESIYSLGIEGNILSSKEERRYERWYTQEQLEAIFDTFNTDRDKAIFSLTLDGLRIDEVLSLTIDSIDLNNNEAKTTRSKSKKYSQGRLVILSNRTTRLINDYLFNERDTVEMKLLDQNRIPPRELFLNLRERGDSFGQPVKYGSWLKILKKAAQRAGLDPKRIRTHSGRSTRAQELFNLQSKYPDQLTDNQIKEIMGWSNIDSANPYKNSLDRETALNNINRLEKLARGDLDE